MVSALKRWIAAALLCVILVPVIIYAVGATLVGPYEGESGLIGLMGHIYLDALTGSLSAWLVLLAPCLLALIWVGSFWLRSSIARGMESRQ